MADVQPPEGLREILADAYDHHATTVYPQRTQPGRWSWACRCGAKSYGETYEAIELAHVPARNHFAAAVLAALFETCTVRERWYVKHLNTEGRSNWARVFNHYAEAVDVEARNRAAAEREGDRSVLLRTVALKWTDPPPPVSSTGEESSDRG